MDKPKLLIVEDDEAIRRQMMWALSDEYEVATAGNREEALDGMRRNPSLLVLLDLGLPPSPRTAEEGIKCLRDMLRVDSGVKVIVVTGNQDRENALRSIELGAFDYFLKPAEMNEVKVVLKRALRLASMELERLSMLEAADGHGFGEIIGESPPMKKIFTIIRKVASTDAPVLLEGESGTGKEIIAKAIHREGERVRKGPFVAINCGAIPENLLEGELFGHEKGAFTGADAQRKGKIEYAAGGTLFLDEVGELPLLLQVKLLRFLQEYTIERIGGRETIPVNVRIIAATNRNLEKETREGRFREDLYYRLGVVTIHVPPLRERGEDVLLLADYIRKRSSNQYDKPVKGFSEDALAAIRGYGWPGNVRELENKIRRAVIMCEMKFLAPADLNLASSGSVIPTESLREMRYHAEREHIRRVLLKHGWNITRAAEELEVSRPTLHDMIKKYGIEKKP